MHTPISSPGTDGQDRVLSIMLRGRRRTIAHVYGLTDQERDERAAYFVRAVNSHAALLAALEAAAICLADHTPLHEPTRNQIRAALAAVKEG